MSATQEQLVERQFGQQAQAYVASAVHAAGADLDLLGDLVRAAPGRVLDLGCGGGHVAYAAAAAGGEVTACDLSPGMLEAVAAEATRRGLRVTTRQALAEHLPFPDASFDMVLSRFSAHHWSGFDAGLREAARVLRPGGTAAFVDVVSPGEAALDTWLQAIELLRDTSHVRDRSTAEWIAALAAAGFGSFRVMPARLRMDFTTWIARMATPPELETAIRTVQAATTQSARRHFAVEPDGSFTVDTATIVCTVAA